MQYDKVQNASTTFVVGKRATGRIFKEADSSEEAAVAFAHMTDSTGYYIFTRDEWEKEIASPYEVTQLQLQKMVEGWEDINLIEVRNNFSSNPRIKHRMSILANQILGIVQEVDAR